METDVLELLLSREPKSPREEKEVKIKRLSPKGEEPVVFTLKSLGYSRAAELKRMDNPEQPLFILLEGVTSPNLKDQRLLDHYGAATPAELLKKMLLPGEIDDLCREVEKLSGYRRAMLEEVKKK